MIELYIILQQQQILGVIVHAWSGFRTYENVCKDSCLAIHCMLPLEKINTSFSSRIYQNKKKLSCQILKKKH